MYRTEYIRCEKLTTCTFSGTLLYGTPYIRSAGTGCEVTYRTEYIRGPLYRTVRYRDGIFRYGRGGAALLPAPAGPAASMQPLKPPKPDIRNPQNPLDATLILSPFTG